MSDQLLKERAEFFYQLARKEGTAGKRDSALLHCAQAVQSILKLYLVNLGRPVPDTFSISYLFDSVKDRSEVYSIYEKEKRYFDLMDDAFYGCRQFPSRYSTEDVRGALSAAELLFNLILP
ncbi:MAG: HEPN domain-containing protein [Thermoprotei archaeon]